MKHDRIGGKRTNWLLIKHRDEFARDGDGEAVLAEDRSVASGRAMAAIAAGKGEGPKPFMLAGRAPARSGRGVAIRSWRWRSDGERATAARAVRQSAPRQSARQAKEIARDARVSSRRSFAKSSSGRRTGRRWVHEIKFDGYRMQLRVEDGRATLLTRKGLDWTAKVSRGRGGGARVAGRNYRRRNRRARR